MATDPTISFIAGGFAGGIASFLTSPLEVVKTRLQSNVGQEVMRVYRLVPQLASSNLTTPFYNSKSMTTIAPKSLHYLRHILKTEGLQALFKGLSLSLVGSVPTRAIYFSMYSKFKQNYNTYMRVNSNGVHFLSAMSAGVVTSTSTSPIWVVKTQMQLDNRPGQLLSLRQCIKSIYRTDGVRGFYRGLTASYAGTIETAIYFVIYERLKQKFYLRLKRDLLPVECMVMAGVSKMIASTFCYPHEVCRTRLRQNVKPSLRRYHSFFQTLLLVWKEEGSRGLYGGMTAHQLRVVPNTAIIFFSFEAIVQVLKRWDTLSYYNHH